MFGKTLQESLQASKLCGFVRGDGTRRLEPQGVCR
jgi:hypothetical protein